MKYAIVLAAGKGTRMRSNQNKVMLKILNKPIIGYVVDHLEAVDITQTVVVTGYQEDEIKTYLGDRVQYATQDAQIGTSNAVASAKQLAGKKGSTLVLSGDLALLSNITLQKIMDAHDGHDLTIVSSNVSEPGHYSRIIRDNQGLVEKVVQASSATALEATSREINLGVYVFDNELLFKYLPEIENDSEEELNISDLVAIMREYGHKIQAYKLDNDWQLRGVNDRVQLAESNQYMRNEINYYHLAEGVSILDSDSTYIGPDVKIGEDTIIYPNVHIYGKTVIGKGVTILPNSWIEDAIIGDTSTIDSSKITNSSIGSHTTVGPFAHIRNTSKVGDFVRVGNFVEFKNTTVGDHTASAHLSYLGDADIGEYVNIGCGVVTVNYDGKDKHRTTIGNNSFIGSHVALIAPLNIGADTVLAAGSTIVEDVESGDLAIARSRQQAKRQYGINYLKEKGKI